MSEYTNPIYIKEEYGDIYLLNENQTLIGELYTTDSNDVDMKEIRANAQLIATAPELLEAAEKIIEKKSVITKNKFQYATIPIGFLIKLEKTIAKAKGEEG